MAAAGFRYEVVGKNVRHPNESARWVNALLQMGFEFSHVIVGCTNRNDGTPVFDAVLIFVHSDESSRFTVVSGFVGGYPGGGPRALAYALHQVDSLDIGIRVGWLDGTQHDEILRGNADPEKFEDIAPWRVWPELGDPPPAIDSLLNPSETAPIRHWEVWEDLALDTRVFALFDRRYWQTHRAIPQRKPVDLVQVFVEIETLLRKRISESGANPHEDKTGVQLINDAFGKAGSLRWPDAGADSSLHEGRRAFLASCFQTIRNRDAHRHPSPDDLADRSLDELIAYRAFGLIHRSIPRDPSPSVGPLH